MRQLIFNLQKCFPMLALMPFTIQDDDDTNSIGGRCANTPRSLAF